MDRTGEKLRKIRERLKLTYRDVEQASQQLAQRRGSNEFLIPLSRLADIENNGKVPSLFRLYTLCVVYRLEFPEVLRWYGIPLEQMGADTLHVMLAETHPVPNRTAAVVTIPHAPEGEIDLDKTTFLSHLIRQWGKVPLGFLNGIDLKQHRYGLIGLNDWSMYPLLRPGSLVMIDEGCRKITRGGWANEFDRPIYFLEHRDGYLCGWCALEGNHLMVQPHPASDKQPSVFRFPDEIDIIGQITGVAMLLEPAKRGHSRSAVTPNKPI
ncbi:MAG TPA: helix-turn-helix transcriptional regulator [Bryobacteraceae bacterium]|nr:helix-turn-helix transcriptional regulator [Bryobacteraceae bacterium]